MSTLTIYVFYFFVCQHSGAVSLLIFLTNIYIIKKIFRKKKIIKKVSERPPFCYVMMRL